MNHCVPDFEMGDDYSLPTFSNLTRPRKSSLPNDDVVELLWQDGQVVMQSQNQRSIRKSSPSKFVSSITQSQSEAREIRSSQLVEEHSLFMQEDEMAAWLNYPLVDDPSLDHHLCTDLLYPAMPHSVTHSSNMNMPVSSNPLLEQRPSATAATMTLMSRLPISPGRIEAESKGQCSFHFSRNQATFQPSNSKMKVRESTVVDSCDTPHVGPESRALDMEKRNFAEASNVDVRYKMISGGEIGGTSAASGDGVRVKETAIYEMTVTSSPGGSSASAEPPPPKPVDEERKRKGRAPDDVECHSEDIEYEFADAKTKQLRGSTSTKRSRAAEVHNLSERRRRDRINEKMKALQELIPRCNKTDKASMLDEAIEYLKTLQLQVQMMSMGCGMIPMMFPGVQQYMQPPMGMGIGMGIGVGMEMGMNRQMMQFPSFLAGSTLPIEAGAAHLGPRFPLPNFAMPPVPISDPSGDQASNQPSDQMLNSVGTGPGFFNSYQQFLGSNQTQFSVTPPPSQNQTLVHPNTSRGPENHKNQ